MAKIAEVVQSVANHRARADDEELFLNKRYFIEAAREVLGWDASTIQAWRNSHGMS